MRSGGAAGSGRAGGVAQGALLGAEDRPLLHPAAQLARPHTAPAVLAFVQGDQGVRRQEGADGSGLGPTGPDRHGLVRAVEDAAAARGDGAVDPGHGAVGVADLSPLAGFGDYLNGQAGGAIFPQDAIVEPWPLTRAHLR